MIDRHGYRTLKDNQPTNYNNVIVSDIQKEEIDRALVYVTVFIKHRKTINNKYTSYNLKHSVERYYRHHLKTQEPNYISNGAIIVAMLQSGFEYRTDTEYFRNVGSESLNLYFNAKIPRRVFE